MSCRAVLILVSLGACSSNAAPVATATMADAATAMPVVDAGDRVPPVVEAPATAADPEPTYEEVAGVLAIEPAACAPSMPAEARIRCLYDQRYRGDPKAADLAYELFVRSKIVAGVEHAHTMNGGYRGLIQIEPATPVNAERQHLEWVVTALRDFERFFDDLARHGREDGGSSGGSATHTKKPYRWRPITLRFFRSALRTPSAYALDWTVSYNLLGSLNKNADAVRETMFHELFHLNDYARPPTAGSEKPWSDSALRATFDAISKRCGAAIPCLAPYTPSDTLVRGGTYYAFQPGNGLPGVEYAAELATRYYREHRAIFRGLPRLKPFKCGPPENARAWKIIGAEYFGNVDAVPACP